MTGVVTAGAGFAAFAAGRAPFFEGDAAAFAGAFFAGLAAFWLAAAADVFADGRSDARVAGFFDPDERELFFGNFDFVVDRARRGVLPVVIARAS
jgi:hypothetical protein